MCPSEKPVVVTCSSSMATRSTNLLKSEFSCIVHTANCKICIIFSVHFYVHPQLMCILVMINLVVCPSVCILQAGIVLKWLYNTYTGNNLLHYLLELSIYKILTMMPLTVALNEVGCKKIAFLDNLCCLSLKRYKIGPVTMTRDYYGSLVGSHKYQANSVTADDLKWPFKVTLEQGPIYGGPSCILIAFDQQRPYSSW